ncbi:hypothetical protein KW529_17200 [Vibrio fluvialis]|nr:hypothetical protein [Vibrio fluvialis]
MKGGAGFIGSAGIYHIINVTQDSVINVCKLTLAGNLEFSDSVCDNPRYTFEQVEICGSAEFDLSWTIHKSAHV